MKKILFAIILAFFFLLATYQNTYAAEEGIERYETQLAIGADGIVSVRELIDYMFVSPRHGIFRTIPTVKTTDEGKRYVVGITDEAITDEFGEPYQMQKSAQSDTVTFKIGNPDVTVTGPTHYAVSYRATGALTYFSGHDELYWNAIGTEWTVPIAHARVTVTLPGKIDPENLMSRCFVGPVGSKEETCSVESTNNGVVFSSSRPLDVSEGMTVVVGFPKGLVAVVEPTPIVSFWDTTMGKIVLFFLFLLGLLWYILLPVKIARRWWLRGRDPKPAMGETHAWFSPPVTQAHRNLTPAEAGTLVDERAEPKDVYATIVDLARRGYMKILETKPGSLDLSKTKDWTGDSHILPFERVLLSGIFASSDLVHLGKIHLAATLKKVQGMIYESLVKEGFFPENPDSIRNKYYVLAFFGFLTVNPLLFLAGVIFGTLMPRKTEFGAQGAAVGRSLKNFLVSQDEKLAFQAKHGMMFEKLLPYAVAFGVEKIWAQKFKDLNLPPPAWYVSSAPGRYSSAHIVKGLQKGARVSFASSVGTKSSSGFSSGFTGGGSSGGGGGGGGGGSW